MNFTADIQTLTDLDIFGKRGRQSVYAIFNHTQTNGGAQLLEQMFRFPLGDHFAINRRSAMIRYLHSLHPVFPLSPAIVDIAEKYLANTDARTQLGVENNDLRRKFNHMIGSDVSQQLLINGIAAVVAILHGLQDFNRKTPGLVPSGDVNEEFAGMHSLLNDPCWKVVFAREPGKKPTFNESVDLDKLFRFTKLELLKQLFHFLYLLDVYIAASRVAEKAGMQYAVAWPKGEHSVKLFGVYHPFLNVPVANTIEISSDRNVLFLTGANMAGKSTFMKSVGIAIFLAHMGFPVPAKKMEFSVCDGILTSINLNDNLSKGYSHFYSEVLRVKKMAEQVKMGMQVFVIFDELFRGTNVRDAYDGTVAITAALTQWRNCMFMVSTHIMEAGEALQAHSDRIHFVFLPTNMEGGKPVYSYRLETGISDDRHGMMIIQNEDILGLLKKDHTKLS